MKIFLLPNYLKYLNICLFAYLLICLFAYLLICLFAYLNIYLFIYLNTQICSSGGQHPRGAM